MINPGQNAWNCFVVKIPNLTYHIYMLQAQRDLDWKLKSRLSAEDLISKGILLGREQSPHILQNKIRLERAKTVDLLKKKILARPPK